MRFNSGSLRNVKLLRGLIPFGQTDADISKQPLRFQAFKAVPPNLIGLATKWSGMPFEREEHDPTCRDITEAIVAEITSTAANMHRLPGNFIRDEPVMT